MTECAATPERRTPTPQSNLLLAQSPFGNRLRIETHIFFIRLFILSILFILSF